MTDCSATHPCWQHYGEHQRSFVPACALDLAKAAVQLRAATLKTYEDFIALETNVYNYRSLLNKRWRSINREPFVFVKAPPAVSSVGKPTGKITSLNLADLGL